MTSSLSWVRAPALWLIAVWENPPADGIARKNAPAMQAMPLAASSWSLSIGGSSRRRTAPATDAVSRKHMMAMAKAPGARAPTWSNDGATGVGSPDGTGAIRAMPCSSSDATLTRTMPRATASSGAGTCGTTRPTPSSTASVAAENATVVQLDVAEVVDDAGDLGEEALGVGVALDAEQLGELAGGDGEADADLDPDQRRLGDVVDQRAEAQQPGGEEDQRRRAA